MGAVSYIAIPKIGYSKLRRAIPLTPFKNDSQFNIIFFYDCGSDPASLKRYNYIMVPILLQIVTSLILSLQ